MEGMKIRITTDPDFHRFNYRATKGRIITAWKALVASGEMTVIGKDVWEFVHPALSPMAKKNLTISKPFWMYHYGEVK